MAEIELSKKNFFYNLKTLERLSGSKERIMAVLKDNAYGHGLEPMAQMTAEFGIRSVAVRNCSEATVVAGLFEEVLILSDKHDPTLPGHCHYALNSLIHLESYPPNTTVHLKVDTGMGRNGVPCDGAIEALDALLAQGLKLGGLFSHLSSADEPDGCFLAQEQRFDQVRLIVEKQCLEHNHPRPLFHLYNSAGLMRRDGQPDRYDRVRPGIALYGYGDLPAELGKRDLKPVLKLWANRIATRTLKKADRVGYGGVFQAPKQMVASTYDVGYGDGFLRLNGHEGYLAATGKRILGRVSMDSMSIEGDQDRICVLEDADSLARARGTISYEALVRLNPALRRTIVDC